MIKRYDELDSLRGLAALSVFLGHMYLIFNETFLSKLLFEYGPLRVGIAGSEAVTLFFVLSGFVLSLPFYTNKNFNYGEYIIKRVCRIYMPYIAAVVIALICKEMFYTGKINGLTDWFNGNWSQPVNTQGIMNHLLLVGTFLSTLNNVVWSLVHEMRISLVFPFMMFILTRVNLKMGVGLGILLSGISVIYSFVSNASFWGTELYVTIHYSAIFIVGALLAKYREVIGSKFSPMGIKGKCVLLLIGIVLYLYAHPSFILNVMVNNFNPFYRMVIDSWFTSIGAGILIIFAISSGLFSKVLRNKFVNYLGKISYSLYLSHLAVLVSCVHLLNRIMPIWVICLIVVIGTFAVASIMYYLVERPSIKLGRKLTSRNKEIKKTNIAS